MRALSLGLADSYFNAPGIQSGRLLLDNFRGIATSSLCSVAFVSGATAHRLAKQQQQFQ